MAKLANWDPAKHPHGEHGHWAATASGDGAAQRVAAARAKAAARTADRLKNGNVVTAPRTPQPSDPKSNWNFTGSKETQYHHRHIAAGQLEKGRDLESSQDELYALMRKGMTFEQAKAHLAKPDTVRASTTGPKQRTMRMAGKDVPVSALAAAIEKSQQQDITNMDKRLTAGTASRASLARDSQQYERLTGKKHAKHVEEKDTYTFTLPDGSTKTQKSAHPITHAMVRTIPETHFSEMLRGKSLIPFNSYFGSRAEAEKAVARDRPSFKSQVVAVATKNGKPVKK